MDIGNILSYGWPGAEFSIGETYESLQWFSQDIPKPTLQEIEAQLIGYKKNIALGIYKNALNDHLDKVANEKDYDNRLTIVSYINSTNDQWKAEAQAFILLRDSIFTYALNIMSAVLNEQIKAPSLEEFFTNAPTIVWP